MSDKEFSVEQLEELLAGLGVGESWQRGGDYWDNNTITAYNGTDFVADCGNKLLTNERANVIAAAPSLARQLIRVIKETEELKARIAEFIAGEGDDTDGRVQATRTFHGKD